MKMFLVVEVKEGKVIWTDTRVNETKEDAEGCIKIYNKATKNKRKFQVAQVTNCKLVS